ncbi:CE1759 family FMN reductase [Nocardioides sp. NPDC092400]|uniref:CE1759 family FMN reductase n=1 Tax=Nocardioides sp. NPDC092400 TaxID=3155196 RepID=UPI003417FB7C
MKRVVVVSAGLSVPSSTRLLADRLAAATVAASDEPIELQTIELRTLAHGLADHLVTGFPTGEVAEAISAVGRADALIVVTPVFTASYSGLFKTFVDVMPREYFVGKPVLVAATAGSARHSLMLDHAMRPLFSYLKAALVPTGVFAATDDFGASSDGEDPLRARIDRAAAELASMLGPRAIASAGSAGRNLHVVSGQSDLEDVAPFEELLRRASESGG